MGRPEDCPRDDPKRRLPGVYLLAGLVCLLPAGCVLHSSPSLATVPHEWRDRNSWGPEANAARAAGTLQPRFQPPRAAESAVLAQQHIQEGDFLFRYGISYDPYGNLTASFISDLADSPFSHDAIAHWEGDVLYVYDIVPEPEGVRKMPFAFWAMDNAPHSFVVKRLRPEYQGYIPGAMAFIEDAYHRQVPFDASLRPDDERLYCSELLEKAFRSAGLVLSEPVPICCLPNYARYSLLRPLAEVLVDARADERVFAPGNQHYGLFGSPRLELVYSELRAHREQHRKGLRCPAEAEASTSDEPER